MAVLYIILIILAVLLIFSGILLFTKLRLIVSIGDGGVFIKLSKFGFSFTLSPDKLNKNQENKKPEDTKNAQKLNKEDGVMKKFFDMRNNFMRQKKAFGAVLSYLRGKIILNEAGIIGKFGTGSPMTGGIAYGTVCGFVNAVSAFLGNFFVLEKAPVINVDFLPEEAVIEIKTAFLIDARPYDVLKAFFIYKKFLKKEKM